MSEPGVKVFVARSVITMDPGRPRVSAVAVKDGRVLSTGTVESMQPWLSQFDYTVDETFSDKIILPGLLEPHSHCWMSAGFMSMNYIGPLPWPSPDGTMNEARPTFDDVMADLRRIHEKESDPTKTLIAWGFDPANQGGSLDRDTLDQISTDRPIYVLAFAPHFAYLNSAAIEQTGLSPDVKSSHVRKYGDGRLSGVFTEPEGVTMGITPIFPEIIKLGGVPGLHFMAGIANRAGITTIADLMFGVINHDTELADHRAATADPTFPVRMRLTPHGPAMTQAHGDEAVEAVRDLQQYDTDTLFFRGVKFFTDGSFPLMGSLVKFPGYLDGSNGLPGDTDSAAPVLPYWQAGMQIHVHANGDDAVDAALDVLAELQAAQPRFDHRYSVEHYSMSNQMQARRLKALGGVASVNNYFSHFRSLLHRTNAYGPDRSDTTARLATLEREGVTFALHSDYPQVVVPMRPLTAVWAAANRIAEDGETVVAPDERISVERALRAVTIDAAYILGLEDKIGSLEQGKFADFAVLDEDPLEVDPVDVKDIPVWGTVRGGELFQADP